MLNIIKFLTWIKQETNIKSQFCKMKEHNDSVSDDTHNSKPTPKKTSIGTRFIKNKYNGELNNTKT